MPRISPFTGLVFDPAVAGPLEGVTAPPYDVIGDEARRAFLRSSVYSVVHLDLSEDGDHGDRYGRAASLLAGWRADRVLLASAAPRYYAYQMDFRLDARERSIRGLFCALELEDWGGRVIPHERTMPGPIEDRLRLLRATETNLSAVYGTIRGPCAPLGALLDRVCSTPPPHAMTDAEGVVHRMWPVDPDPGIAGWLEAEPLLIADGHHRYTTALRYRDERRSNDGPGPWDAVLALVVDAGSQELPVLPFHRVVLGGPAPTAGARVRDLAEVLAELDDAKLVYGTVTREDGTLVHRVAGLEGDPPTVAALHDQILGTELSEGLRFTPDAADAESAVRGGDAAVAYLLPPTTTDRIREVIERRERLPQKSTFFWPKPRTGMVMRPLE